MDDKEKLNNNKDYLGSRYSEQVFGDQGGRVTDSSNKQMESKEKMTKELFWKASGDEDYTKQETLGIIILFLCNFFLFFETKFFSKKIKKNMFKKKKIFRLQNF